MADILDLEDPQLVLEKLMPDETIPAVISRIRDAQRAFVNARPDKYEVSTFDAELFVVCHVTAKSLFTVLTSVITLNATPAYSTLTETLLTKPTLTPGDVEAALVTAEETRAESLSIAALNTSTPPHPVPSSNPNPKSNCECHFCDAKGHTTRNCRKMKQAKAQANQANDRDSLAEFAGNASALSTPSSS
ncbi:uncharacterized protein EI90DRAFT_3136779 [Cantharellus anzutake]|uniref:uncharacterized protein n=1 Tax=Cantharellus anzutake TaxID=1750568 RepID=UPI001903AF5C|nr:uncharacterized protein EI90DRAFT_3136779 [Cantharellus anzutake]KAF8313325.1 hypothetical protein EI90DRAFT_3136779 [Cantharellus anzutake]